MGRTVARTDFMSSSIPRPSSIVASRSSSRLRRLRHKPIKRCRRTHVPALVLSAAPGTAGGSAVRSSGTDSRSAAIW